MQTKEQRIEAELARLSELYQDMEPNRRSLIQPLLERAAFMQVSLEDLEEEIARSGVVEHYQNGANQFGLKQSAAVQAYNSLIKNYASVIKSLSDKLPYKRQPTYAEILMAQRREEAERRAEEERRAREQETGAEEDVEEYEEEPEADEEYRPFGRFSTFEEWSADYQERKALGRLTPMELENERQAEENRRQIEEADRLQRDKA